MNQHTILFRAKSLEKNEWVEGFYHGRIDPCQEERVIIEHFIWNGLGNLGSLIKVDPGTVGQFIGKLRNEQRVFIGDLVKHGETIRIVEYRNGNTCLTRQNGESTILLSFSENPEVVGNIHDNPELLKS